MKTKLAFLCLSLIASNSYSMCYLEEEDLGPVTDEVAQAWQDCSNECKEQLVQNTKKPRPQNPVIEPERQEDEIDSELVL